jgi:ABC-type transport system substrate-binding protein
LQNWFLLLQDLYGQLSVLNAPVCGTFFHKPFKAVLLQLIVPKKEKEKKMRKETTTYALVALVIIMVGSMFTVLPAQAFIYPDTTYDSKYEFYGPHADQIVHMMYSSTDPEFTALELGQIDLTDEPLDTTTYNLITTDPNYQSNISVVSAGGEAGFYTLDFNVNPNYHMGQIFPFVQPYGKVDPVGRPNPVYINATGGYTKDIPPISTDQNFRLAVCHLFNRSLYTSVIGASGVQMLTVVPPYMGKYTEGGYVWDECPGYSFNVTLAGELLNASKIYKDPVSGKRYWDFDASVGDPNNPGAIPQIEFDACKLILTYRANAIRKEAGLMITAQLTNLGFVFKPPSGQVAGDTNYQIVMLNKNYHISTLGWIFIGPDPDFLYDLYHISAYWDDPESSASNTAALNDTILNDNATQIKFNMDPEAARTAAKAFQERFWTIGAQLPLACNNAFKAMSKYYTGGNLGQVANPDDGENQYRLFPNGTKRAWIDAANQAGFGSNSWFSKLDMYPAGTMYGDNGNLTIRYGWSEQGYPQHINPFYSEWYWDSEVLGPIYDTLGYRDPYVLANWKGDIAQNWTVGTWLDGSTTKSKVTVTIRQDCYFQDGKPVTLADVIYSLVESGKALIAKGYPPPWWWPTGSKVRSMSVLSPYTVEILFDVSSYLVKGWTLGGFAIVPKHIWKPIIDSSTPRPPNVAVPDVNVVGSGPYRFKTWFEGVSLVMVANTPGSTVTTSGPGTKISGSVPTTSPGYHAWLPVKDPPYTTNYVARYDPGTVVTFNVPIDNLWWGGALNISAHAVITWPNVSTSITDYTLTNLAAHTSDLHTLGPYTMPRGVVKIVVNSTITSTVVPTWTNKVFSITVFYWGTIKEDIAGSTMYDLLGLPSYPYKKDLPTPDGAVEIKDVAAASKAYGAAPGDPRWWSQADIVKDYYVDIRDIAAISKKYGY